MAMLEITKIILDLDGVLVDFVSYMCHYLGIPEETVFSPKRPRPLPWDLSELLGVDVEFTPDIEWDKMPPTPWARELFELSRKTANEVVIASDAKGYDPHIVQGKLNWIKKYFPELSPELVIFTKKKYLLANPESILIDDCMDNCDGFIAHGGVAIPFPAEWNKNWKYSNDPMAYVSKVLDNVLDDYIAY